MATIESTTSAASITPSEVLKPEVPPSISETTETTISTLWEIVARIMGAAKDEVGQALLEFAIITPVVLLLMFGAIDVEIAVMDLGSVHFPAEQAAICQTRAAQ